MRPQILMTGRSSGRRIGRKFGRTFLGIFVLHALCRTTHSNASQFITPCLVTALVGEMSKCHLRELLGHGAPNPKKSREAAVPTKMLFKENAPFTLLFLMGSFARTLFICLDQFSVSQGKFYIQSVLEHAVWSNAAGFRFWVPLPRINF